MKIQTKFTLRKMKNNIKQLVSMGILIAVASLFFTTLFSFKDSYKTQTEQYFEEQNYADTTLYGFFNKEDVNKLLDMREVHQAEGRWVQEYNEDNFSARLISLTSKVNIPFLLEGKLPTNKNEIAIINQYYEANSVKLNDDITIGSNTFTVVGVVDSPEYIYYVKNARTLFTDARNFLIGYVSSDLFNDYNQLIFTQNALIDETILKQHILFEQLTKQHSQINYQMYDGDLDQFASFAYIFPTIFWIMSFCIIYIILRRTVLKEHKYIGIMQAIGQSKNSIIRIYLFQFVFLGIFSSLIGCILSIPVSRLVIYAFKSMIELPNLRVNLQPTYWVISIVVSFLGCLVFGLISMLDILSDYPHESMKSRAPKNKNNIKSKKKSLLWEHLSFNTRYSIKTALRNKSRFLVMVIGLSSSTALLIFSLGFNDSLNKTIPQYFQDFASYDLIIETEPKPLEYDLLSITHNFSTQDKALQISVNVNEEEYSLIILENNVQSLALSESSLKDGIIIPEYYAEKWDVEIGDTILINSKNVVISDIIPLGMGLSIFTSSSYANSIFEELPNVYNTIYVETNELGTLCQELKTNGITFSSAQEDKDSFDTMLNSFQIIIILLVVCGVILGMTVIICMNIMNLASREFEYMFMNIMGYSKERILLSIFKETIIQLLLAIPLGLVLGYQLINLIKGEFSQNTFALYPVISFTSYLMVIILVIIMSMTRIISSNKYINSLDIVEGLKIQED